MPRPNRRSASAFAEGAPDVKNTMNSLKRSSNQAQTIKNSVALKPKPMGYSKIKGAVTG